MIPHPPGPISPEQAQVRRLHDAVLAGQHPISVAEGRPLMLHPDAAPALDMSAPGLRCSGCRWKASSVTGLTWCIRPDGIHLPELRTWFPACTEYEPPGSEP